MIIEKAVAKKSLAVALALALFAGSPLTAFAQVRVSINANVPAVTGAIGAAGSLGAAPGAMGLSAPISLAVPSLAAPSLAAAAPAPSPLAALPAALVRSAAPALLPALAAPAIASRPVAVKNAAALAAVKTLPVGSARETMVSFLGALSDPKMAAASSARIFDAGRKLSESEEDAVSASADGEGVSAEAGAMHDAWQAASAARVAAFEETVKQVKSGRIGVKLAYQVDAQGRFAYGYLYTLDGAPMPQAKIAQSLKAASVTPAEWNAAKKVIDAAVPELVKEIVSILKQNETEHAAVHEKMNAIAKKSAAKAAKATLQKGADLEAWGVPLAISIDQSTRLRYARTYRLNGAPTDLGEAMHAMIAPLVAADPGFLAKVTAAQLHEAAQYLNDSLKYSLNDGTPDGQKKMRMGAGRGEGYDYPEAQKALIDLARRKLLEAPLAGDQSAGLGPVAPEQRPALVMKSIFQDLMEKFEAKAQAGAPADELETMKNLLISMHAALGVPVRTSNGMAMLPIAHSQLRPILAELSRRNTDAQVVRAVIRSFPMGESLLRLGVADLWARGITGKGVKVAVIDNGVDFGHPDFADIENPRIENLTRDRGVHTKGGHGTPMASIVHAIAPDAVIESYQALPNTDGLVGVALTQAETMTAVLKAMDLAAANGAHIISMSLGFPMAYSDDPISMKVTELTKKGVIFIVSAGNEGGELPKGMQIRSPAASPDAIAVGAVDYHGKIASFSSEGVVFNPTEGTASEKPDIYASGVSIKAAMQLPGPMYAQEPVPYNPVSGTSPAAPHVSGVAALMLGAALAAGADIANAGIPGAVRQGLTAGVKRIERLPVLSDAAAAVDELVRLLTPGV